MTRTAWLSVAVGALAAATAPAQAPAQAKAERSLSVGPAYMQRDGVAGSPGIDWDAGVSVKRRLGQPMPISWKGSARSTGALAWNPRANATPMQAIVDGGVAIDFERMTIIGPDGEVARRGGHYGTLSLTGRLGAEGDQRLEEANAAYGVGATYIHSRLGWFQLVPGIEASFSGIATFRSALRDSLGLPRDGYTRGEIHAAWHLPTFWPRLGLHANLWFWSAGGIPPTLEVLDRDDGRFAAYDVSYATPRWRIGPVGIPEIFLRRIEGHAPVGWEQERAWMIGIVTGKP